MTCEVFLTEVYGQRPGESTPLSQEFADHLRSCAVCSQKFAEIVEKDTAIRRTICSVEPPAALEATILSGLALDRAAIATTRRGYRRFRWLLVPAACVLGLIAFLIHTQWQARVVITQAASLLRSTPASAIQDGDRNEILRWAAQAEPGTDVLPGRLSRLEFRGASLVKISNRVAVLLLMKHEPRASLLIVDQTMPGAKRIASQSSDDGSLAYWTEQKKTYVLLFHGNLQDMQAYMQRMGITA